MATFILVNTIRLASGVKYAGEIVDDAQENATLITSAGGVLFPTGVASVDDAATLARSIRARGGKPEDSESIMNAAVDALQQSEDGTLAADIVTAQAAADAAQADADTAQTTANAAVVLATVQTADVTLVAGAATESTLNYTASSIVVPIRNTAGGTPADLSVGTITPGSPGSAAIAGGGSDTSTVTVLVIG